MKSCSIFFLLSIFASQSHCQIITGKVVDASNGLPLEYVSIGIVEMSFGTLTNEKGVFSLEVKGQSPKAQVRFSMIGFKSQTFTLAELSGETNIIKLKNEPIQLAEVIIKPTGKEKKVGTTNYTLFGGYCGWLGTKKECSFSKRGSEAKWSRLDSESPSFYLTVQE